MSLAANRSYTYDSSMLMKDAGLIAASAAAQVSSADKILDLGGADPFLGVLVIDVTALEVASNDELFGIIVQGSASSSFAGTAAKTLAEIRLGSAGGKAAGESVDAVGRFELPFLNVQNGTVYRYIRVYTLVAGTIATGINYSAFIGEVPKGF
jgi:hypothetical protein